MTEKSKPAAPRTRTDEEFESLVLGIAELLRGATTPDDRRNLALTMLARGMRPSEIKAVLCKAFPNTSPKVVDGDLTAARAAWKKSAVDLGQRSSQYAPLMAQATEVLRRANAIGNLSAANKAITQLERMVSKGRPPRTNMPGEDRRRLVDLLLHRQLPKVRP